MNIAYGVAIMAPQTTGHPAGLPAEPAAEVSEQKVAAAPESGGTSGSGLNRGSGEEQAPPTAMQRQIMEMLERQAEKLEER